MARKTDYQYTPVPTHLFKCMDNNCRSVLFSLIQLSTYYESKNEDAFDGWFFRTNALLEEETNLSKNVLNGALDALYQAGIISVIPQDKGRGKTQGARQYKVNYETFPKYQSIPFEECSCQHPRFGIVTSDYKKGAPSFQLQPKLEEQLECGKSDNNIDNIDNITNKDNIDIIEKIRSNNINKNISNYNYNCCHFEEDTGSDGERPVPSNSNRADALKSFSFSSSTTLDISDQVEEHLDPPSPSITAEFIESQIPFVYAKVNGQGETQEHDNYSNAANDILDERAAEISNWVACVKSKTMFCDTAMERLVDAINEREYDSQADCEKTALDLMTYAAKKEAQYLREMRAKLNA